MQIRSRFAPSPTGDMHIGNLRTAIFNWLFAKQNKGLFFVRIEDTDEKRSDEIYEKRIFEMLKWLGLDFDLYEGDTIKQSERKEIYCTFAKKIPNTYYCQCVEKNICECFEKKYQSGVLRFKVKKGFKLQFCDLVFGQLETNSEQIEDFALLRSDNTPTYNLAVVIDDYLMQITHVIRGEDHKTNTFKQIALYEVMGWPIPQFAHLPIIKGTDGKKLSKRQKSSSAQELYEEGLCSSAIFNILLKMGWGHGNEELINKDKALEIFSVKGIKKHSCVFETKKLYSFSRKYMLHSKEEALTFIEKFYGQVNKKIFNYFYDELAPKCSTFREMVKIAPFILEEDNIEKKKHLFNISLEELKKKSLQEQKNIRLAATGSQDGLSLTSLWKFYNI